MSLKESNVDRTIDVKGQICPYPLINTRDALKGLEIGQVLEVVTDHLPAAKETIPGMCKKKDYPLEVVDGDGVWRVFIKKTS